MNLLSSYDHWPRSRMPQPDPIPPVLIWVVQPESVGAECPIAREIRYLIGRQRPRAPLERRVIRSTSPFLHQCGGHVPSLSSPNSVSVQGGKVNRPSWR